MTAHSDAGAVRPFTGRHMAVILVAFFGVVIAVNVLMAHYATSSFTGEVVENSYVASQNFNRWLDEARREKALGWQAGAERMADGRVSLRVVGLPADARVEAVARHPLGRAPDRALAFRPAPGQPGHFVSAEALPEGRWRLRLTIRAGGSAWRAERDVS